MDSSDPLFRLTVAQALEQDYVYSASCKRCGVAKEVDLEAVPRDLPCREIRARLRCACGQRDAIITFLPRRFYERYLTPEGALNGAMNPKTWGR